MYADLFTQDELSKMIEAGYVRSNAHPEADLYILNYTEKAAYEGVWNNVTLNCRGLIVDLEGNVVARPFPKFFNYGQTGCPEIDLDAPAIVSDKMDGSLGILYSVDGELAIATRGSFTSDQAIHATNVLHTKYTDFQPLQGWTYLFEIVYPENRIVCNYEGMDDLVFLGAVNITTGLTLDSYYGMGLHWNGPKAEIFSYQTMREALAAKPRPGREGFVVHFIGSNDIRVKIKQEDYIALHRIVTGLNARSVWQAMLDDTVDELIEKIPDEFHDFVKGVQEDIEFKTAIQLIEIESKFHKAMSNLTSDAPTKKDYAMLVKNDPYAWALFKKWDGVDRNLIWKELIKRAKPAHNFSPIKQDEDSA